MDKDNGPFVSPYTGEVIIDPGCDKKDCPLRQIDRISGTAPTNLVIQKAKVISRRSGIEINEHTICPRKSCNRTFFVTVSGNEFTTRLD